MTEPEYEVCYKLSVAYASRVVGYSDAEDIAHDVVVAYFSRAIKPSNPKAWVIGATSKMCANLVRKRLRRNDAPLYDVASPGMQDEVEVLEHITVDLDPCERSLVAGRLEGVSVKEFATHRGLTYEQARGIQANVRKKTAAALAAIGIAVSGIFFLWPENQTLSGFVRVGHPTDFDPQYGAWRCVSVMKVVTGYGFTSIEMSALGPDGETIQLSVRHQGELPHLQHTDIITVSDLSAKKKPLNQRWLYAIRPGNPDSLADLKKVQEFVAAQDGKELITEK